MVAYEFALVRAFATNPAVDVAVFAVENSVAVHVGIDKVGDAVAIDVLGMGVGLAESEAGNGGHSERYSSEGSGFTIQF